MLRTLAVVGVGFVVFQAWGIAAWMFSDDFVSHSVTASMPSAARNGVRLGERLMEAVALAWLIYLVTDLVRRRTLTWPLLITVTWLLTYWAESLANVTGPRFAYNSAFVDRGDWTRYLPFIGHHGPGLNQPLAMEPFVFAGLLPLIAFGVAALMRTLRRRTSLRSPWALGAIAYVVVLGVEFGAEVRSIGQGVHGYPEVFGALSIHAGSPHQFPLYENWLLAAMWFLPGLVLFLVRDNPADDSVPTPPGGAVTVLAAVGAMNIVFVLYNLIAFIWLPGNTSATMPPWLTP